MKKLVGILVILALPAMAYAEASTWLSSSGSASKSIDVAALPTTMTLDVMVSWTTTDNFSVSGGVDGPAVITIGARAYGAPFNLWVANTADAQYLGTTLAQEMDYGALPNAGVQLAGSGTQKFVTLTLNIPVMAKGAYPMWISDGMPYGQFTGTGFWAAMESGGGTGDPAEWDHVTGFTLNITPEPATMLLLAGALPFLRRRTA